MQNNVYICSIINQIKYKAMALLELIKSEKFAENGGTEVSYHLELDGKTVLSSTTSSLTTAEKYFDIAKSNEGNVKKTSVIKSKSI